MWTSFTPAKASLLTHTLLVSGRLWSIGKYGNWDPTISIKLGDFGTLNEDSGAFDVQGTIFEGDFANRNADLLRALGSPTVLPPEDYRVVRSIAITERITTTDVNL
jgi:hypothetical protein